MVTLKDVLYAKRIAVVGASRDPSKPGAMLLRVLKDIGFRGLVAGVNPQGGEVNGTRLYKSLQEVPFEIDLAVVLIPPRLVPKAMEECARKGVKGVVISSEGFAESGPEGARIQEEVRKILRNSGMRGFGPNTLGLVNTETRLTTSYFATKEMVEPGPVGVAAQSGIFVGALLRYLSSLGGIHLSKGMGLGNKMDVNESDALEFLSEDPQTKVVAMYLEDLRDGRRFLEVARKASKNKPILLLKGARTLEGTKASSSHTGSLAVEDRVLDGALKQANVIRVESIEEMIGALKGFLHMPLPQGPNISLVTYSGAQAILTIDEAIRCGLRIATLRDSTREKLSVVIHTPSKAANPIDLFPDMMNHGFERTSTTILEALYGDPGVDGVIFICFAATGPEPYLPIAELVAEKGSKPVFFSLLGDRDNMEACRAFLEARNIPCFPYPELAARAMSHMWHYSRNRDLD